MLKKSIYWHRYILENSRKTAIFFGFTTYRKKRRERRKKNLLHKEDKTAIFAMIVFRGIVLFFEILVTHRIEEKKYLKNDKMIA